MRNLVRVHEGHYKRSKLNVHSSMQGNTWHHSEPEPFCMHVRNAKTIDREVPTIICSCDRQPVFRISNTV